MGPPRRVFAGNEATNTLGPLAKRFLIWPKGGRKSTPERVGARSPSSRNKLSLLVWHYHDDESPWGSRGQALDLSIKGLPAKSSTAKIGQFPDRTKEHSNAPLFLIFAGVGSGLVSGHRTQRTSVLLPLEKAGPNYYGKLGEKRGFFWDHQGQKGCEFHDNKAKNLPPLRPQGPLG